MVTVDISYNVRMELFIEDQGKRRLAIELVCTGCGITFLQRKDHALVERNHFHSLECHNKWQASQLLMGDKRICTQCKNQKPIDEFYDRSERKGKRNTCKECWAKNSGEYTKINRPLNREKYRENGYNASLKMRYGIDRETYDNLYREQDGKCAICLEPETRMLRGRVSRLSVDHCHKTGKIRGLLCSRCNTFIGLSDHSEERLISAIHYLKRTG